MQAWIAIIHLTRCPLLLQIKAQTEGKFYRKDLTKPALARWYKLWKAQNRSVEDEE